MKKTEADFAAARELASELLESGALFVRERKGGTSYLRRRSNRQGPKIFSIEEAKALELLPKPSVVSAIRDMLITKHEEYQRDRAKHNFNKAAFFKCRSWLTLRYQVLAERGAKCECCGSDAKDGAKMQVDHIKPRSKYPELALEKSNLQVLCKACNMGKSNRSEEDWRERKPARILRKNSGSPDTSRP